MDETLTLDEAGVRLGVDEDQLRRLIRKGGLPEAQKIRRHAGSAWVIPTSALADIARREGWTIDVRGDAPSVYPTAPPTPPPSLALVHPAPAPKADPSAHNPASRPAGDEATPKTADPAQLSPADKPATAPAATAEGEAKASKARPVVAGPPKADPATTQAAASARTDRSRASRTSAVQRRRAANRRQEMAVAEVVDTALLERLLGAQEAKATVAAEKQRVEDDLVEANQAHKQTAELLEVERRERTIALERLRDEHMARAIADTKVAELRERLVREMASLDAERRARIEATRRSLKAERDAATATAAMGWRSRRRFQRLTERDPGRN